MNYQKRNRLFLAALYPIVVTGIALLFCIPSVVHIFDFGARHPMALSQLPNRPTGSRNVTLTDAYLRPELGFDEKLKSLRYGTSQTTLYIPIVGPDWQPSSPVAVILKAGRYPRQELLENNRSGRLDVEIHDVLWEGLDDDLSQEFVRLGLPPVANSFVVVTLPGETPKTGFVVALLVSLASILGGFQIARSTPAPSPSSSGTPQIGGRVGYLFGAIVLGAIAVLPLWVALHHPSGWKNFVSWPAVVVCIVAAGGCLLNYFDRREQR